MGAIAVMHTPEIQPPDPWAIVNARDAGADGRLFYAVRTTGIFCRPSCPSRRPARRNVEFFTDLVSAFRAGYRPCKRCRPAGLRAEAQWIQAACARLNQNLDRPVRLAELAALTGLSAFTVQRVFQRVLGVSPAQYQAHKRAAALRSALADPALRITDAIYEAGYSGSARAYGKDRLGMRPRDYRSRGKDLSISYATGASPVGSILVAATGRGLCAVHLGSDEEDTIAQLARQFPEAALAPSPVLAPLLQQVLSRFTEHPAAIDLPLDLRATAFQMRVWQALQRIPRGRTRSYAELARDIGQPNAVRAVARACAANSVAVVVPCHRVVGSSGSLTGYRWGVERKEKLLEMEGRP
jgi:AraC family transcriptional regulator of adaptative response/methylated-DNA-[protein]-cysteine methyltransferase